MSEEDYYSMNNISLEAPQGLNRTKEMKIQDEVGKLTEKALAELGNAMDSEKGTIRLTAAKAVIDYHLKMSKDRKSDLNEKRKLRVLEKANALVGDKGNNKERTISSPVLSLKAID